MCFLSCIFPPPLLILNIESAKQTVTNMASPDSDKASAKSANRLSKMDGSSTAQIPKPDWFSDGVIIEVLNYLDRLGTVTASTTDLNSQCEQWLYYCYRQQASKYFPASPDPNLEAIRIHEKKKNIEYEASRPWIRASNLAKAVLGRLSNENVSKDAAGVLVNVEQEIKATVDRRRQVILGFSVSY